MRAILWGLAFSCLVGCLLAAAPPVSAGQNDALLFESHPWARFGKGAWRHVRITTQSFNEQGQPTESSVTDNKTTVLEVTADRVTLQVEVTVEIAGQRFPSQPQVIKQSYAGETSGEASPAKPLEAEVLTIDGQEIRCEKQQVDIAGGVTSEISVLTFAADRKPAILRRKSTLSEASSGKLVQEMVSEVVGLDLAHRVLDAAQPKPAYLVRTDQKGDRGTTVIWSWHVPEVPGEIVDQYSKKLDANGRLVRRTTLHVVAYGFADGTSVGSTALTGAALNGDAQSGAASGGEVGGEVGGDVSDEAAESNSRRARRAQRRNK